jgi:RNA polymerase sigma-70 factor (ECF subfamily)
LNRSRTVFDAHPCGLAPAGWYCRRRALQVRGADRARPTADRGLYSALAALRSRPWSVQPRRRGRFADSPRAGLALLAPLLADPRLARYQPLHATHADLLRRAGDHTGAAAAYAQAIRLSANAVERAELERRQDALTAD